MIVPDLNLLIYAYAPEMPQHRRAREWWDGLMNGREFIGLPWVVATGFIRLITHPTSRAVPISPASAVEIVDKWRIRPTVTMLLPGARHLQIMSELLTEAGVGGNLVTDAHIAALAIENQAEVHTNDRDFSRFSGLRWHNPLSTTP